MMPGSIDTALIWAVLIIVPPLAGYWIGKVKARLPRLVLLTLFLPTPIWILTTMMVLLPSSPPSDFGWWIVGMIMIALPTVIWAMLTGAAYLVARRNGS